MNILLLVTTLYIAPAGNVAPEVEVVKVDSMEQCIELSANIHRQAIEDDRQVYTACQAPKALSDYQ